MNIIVCLDDSLGVSFNCRRQSRDSALISRVLELTKENRLFVSEYSAPLFEKNNVIVDNNFFSNAQNGDYCFVETADVFEVIDKIEKVIIYRWNRKYPSDKKFPLTAVLNNKTLKETTDFVGTSHDKITEEIYL